MLKSKFMEF